MSATRRSRFVLSIAALLADPKLAVETKDLVVIPQSAQHVLVAREEKVTLKASAFFLAEWDAKHQTEMTAAGIPFTVILKDVTDDQTLYLFELHDGEDPPAAWRTLYRHGRNVIVKMTDAEADGYSLQGEHSVRLWHEPRGWGRPAQ